MANTAQPPVFTFDRANAPVNTVPAAVQAVLNAGK